MKKLPQFAARCDCDSVPKRFLAALTQDGRTVIVSPARFAFRLRGLLLAAFALHVEQPEA